MFTIHKWLGSDHGIKKLPITHLPHRVKQKEVTLVKNQNPIVKPPFLGETDALAGTWLKCLKEQLAPENMPSQKERLVFQPVILTDVQPTPRNGQHPLVFR